MTVLDVTMNARQVRLCGDTDDWTLKRDCGMSLS